MFKRILHFFFGNLLFKIFAVVLAASIWLLAVLIRPQTESFVIPIAYSDLPNDLVITKYNTNKIIVTLHGRGSDFIKLQFHKPLYQLNLSMAKQGLNRIKLTPDELITTTPVLLKSVSPEYAEFVSEELERKIVSVIVPYRHDAQKGRYITDIEVQDTVILSGPAEQMQFLRQVMTESLFINDITKPEAVCKIKVVLPDTAFFQAIPESVNILTHIEKETTKTFSNIKVYIVSSQKDVTVKPKTADITVRGAVSRVQALQDSEIIIKINPSGLTAGENNIPAEIILPKNIFLVNCDPKLFNIKVE
jgi:YbbR domain-containing protein